VKRGGRRFKCAGEIVVVVVVGFVDFGDLLGETIGKRDAAEGESGMVAAAVVLVVVSAGDCGLTGAV
jgi:hypothetical protein